MAMGLSDRQAPSAVLFWWLCFALLPLLLLQAILVRARAPRLPPVLDNAARGSVDCGTSRRSLLVVGESTAVGVGCHHPRETIVAQLAGILAREGRERVDWQVIGANGARLNDVLALLESQTSRATSDARVALVLLGVNDVTALTSISNWREGLVKLRSKLRQRGVGRIFVAAVPPMGQLTLLPQPLRYLAGMRARLLDAVRYGIASIYSDVTVLDSDFPNDPKLLAADGYHPGPQACRLWAEQVARQMTLHQP